MKEVICAFFKIALIAVVLNIIMLTLPILIIICFCKYLGAF